MKILAVEAHPDDVELLCAGTLARLAALGHEIAILSITPGELGTMGDSLEAAAACRQREAEQSAALLGGRFYSAGIPDKHVFFNDENRNRVTEILRHIRPDLIFAPSPKDYILDHEMSSLLVRDAATAASARLFSTHIDNGAPPTDKIPYLYYCDPVGRIDIFGNPVHATTYVDIAETLDVKLRMYHCHASQVEFLRHRHRVDYTETIRRWGVESGQLAGLALAEGFRQHVAPPFPKDNILVELLQARQVLSSAS